MSYQRLTKSFMTIVVIAGLICLAVAAVYLPLEKLNVYSLTLVLFTIGVGSRITLQIPRFKSHIAVSDTFIFLALLIFGGELAIILSAAEAFFSSWRFCNKKFTVFFNSASMAISTTAVVFVLKAFGFYGEQQLHGRGDQVQNFLVALSIIAVTQFLVNTSIASIYDSLKNAVSFWETWKNKYIWTFLTYFLGASSAGLLVQLSDSVGFSVIIATFPVIFFVFLTYKMYLKNIEISVSQVEQAEKYAEILKSQSEALAESEERFRSAFHHAPIGIALASATGNWLKVNQALCKILGYSTDELLAKDFQSVIFSQDLGLALIKVHEVISGKMVSCQMEQRYIHSSGQTVWASWSVSLASDARTENPNLIFQIQDITDKKLAEEKLQHEATHDPLTGLPNRSLFMKRLGSALEKVRQLRNYRVGVLFIDLDRFKYVNDSLGHLAGDDLLIEISDRLSECLRPTDTVARLGGDEFVILVEGRYDAREVIRIAERVQQKFNIPFYLRGTEIYSSASIGVLHASERHKSSEDIMRDADTAMYQAKRAGKARHAVFSQEMHAAAIETLQLETDLRRAVENEDFSVEYQPIFSLVTGQIQGVEALARWNHPLYGPIAPNKFIGLAEEIGLINLLGAVILRRACLQIGQIKENFDDGQRLSLSVNLSSRQFAQPDLVSEVAQILRETAFSPKDLCLEISESVFFKHQKNAIEMLEQLRESGVELYVDDFGTGYSNLGYLRQLPISTLKIDNSFVGMIGKGPDDVALVRAIVMLARSLGMKVVAEGVETHEQLDELRRLNCDAAQGFLFAEPMTFEKLAKFMANSKNLYLPDPYMEGVSVLAALQ